MPQEGDLKIWWIPQVPMKAFEMPVKNIHEAKLVLNCLAAYDFFQYRTNSKGDYANAGGLLIYAGGEWREWYNQEDDTINEILRQTTDEETKEWLREIFAI